MLRRMLFAIISLLALCGAVSAETTDLRVRDNGVLGAMHRVGCNNPRWLSVVMKKSGYGASGLLETQLNHLKAGTPIVVPDECATTAPSREDATLSRQIFADLDTLRKAKKAGGTPPGGDLTAVNASILALTEKVNKLLEQQQHSLTGSPEVSQKTKKLAAQSETLGKFGMVSAAIALIVLTSAGWFFFPVRHLRKERKELKAEVLTLQERLRLLEGPLVVEDYHGMTFVFRNTTPQPTVGCPRCSNVGIKPTLKSARRHLDTHPYLRLRMLPPGEVRELMRAAINTS